MTDQKMTRPLILTLLLAFLAPPPARSDETNPDASVSVEKLTERVRNSVVVVTSSGRDGRRENVGTGFVVSADGLIATNFHVLGEGRGVHVQLADGRRVDVTAVHASDRALDLAVVRVDAKNLPALELGNSDEVRQGQNVIALGNPHGLKYSVVSGVVSGVREMEGRPMLQLAMPVEPGNSGGPLVDMQGRVQGVLTMKSLVTPKLGFALSINLLKPLLEKPNPIPMSRWLTIGALDAREWQPVFGARWRQRAGRITVEDAGDGFGGRSLCLSQKVVPDRPFELAVALQLDDESGAAGLAFCADGQDCHYGFYPTNGHLRLTRFDGPDVTSWKILYDHASRHYVPGEWNTLRVRLDQGKIRCFVNDELVVETADSGLTAGEVGLVKFRDTKAQFKNFQLGPEVPRAAVPAEEARRIASLVENLPAAGPLDPQLIHALSADADRAAAVLRQRALALDSQARQLRRLAEAAHQRRTIDDLTAALEPQDDQVDLLRCGLLVARLDNEEVDVVAYGQLVDRMARELAARLPADADDDARLEALRKYLFDENGFHGSRGDYYNRANSYLNEVLDDREGLPITLSVVYMELARRIGLKVAGVGLPGHFVVAYVPAEGEQQLIDVFDGAAKVSRQEAETRIRATTDGELSDERLAEVFEPLAKRAIIVRMLTNLLQVAGGDDAVHRYLNAILAVEPDHGPFHFLRAIVRYRLDERPAARDDVEWLLQHKPAGVDLERVMALQADLERE
jgi:S1-C subfamily serine protease/regulator of sirC expression with transglutaminase-like and TPR domain